ncbi:MAG: GtrA family protein [Armatimonadetes bacterium]|nr:GtrA family protein [Armatimonadota bacterium]
MAYKTVDLVQALVARRGIRQFVKFCLVGAVSTVIDIGLLWLLLNPVNLKAQLWHLTAPWPGFQDRAAAWSLHIPVGASLSFLAAVTNGFIWNSRWTFRGYGRTSRRRQFVQFVLVNIVGLWFNVAIVTVVAHTLPVALVGRLAPLSRDPGALIGKVIATPVVAFWNFGANKYWTFAGRAGAAS